MLVKVNVLSKYVGHSNRRARAWLPFHLHLHTDECVSRQLHAPGRCFRLQLVPPRQPERQRAAASSQADHADHRTAASSQAADARRRIFFWMVKTRAKFWAKSTLHLLRTVLIVTAWFQESEVEHDSHDYACTRCGLTVSQRKATMFVLVQVLAEGCVTGSTSARRHRDEPARKIDVVASMFTNCYFHQPSAEIVNSC